MRLLVLVLAGILNVLVFVGCQELSVIRHSDGDIFTLEGSCTEACTVLSSGTASPYTRSPSTAGLVPPNNTCTCQCNYGLPTFREDLHICVNDIHECNVAGFVSGTGQVERVPYVFLPQRGQIIYPHAEIRFEGVTTPVCGITGAQQLGRAGWSELRNLSDTEPPFRLFRDEGRTFLQWIGETGLREAAEGRVVTAKLVCRDASQKSKLPGVFTPCVAFRVAGSQSKTSRRSRGDVLLDDATVARSIRDRVHGHRPLLRHPCADLRRERVPVPAQQEGEAEDRGRAGNKLGPWPRSGRVGEEQPFARCFQTLRERYEQWFNGERSGG